MVPDDEEKRTTFEEVQKLMIESHCYLAKTYFEAVLHNKPTDIIAKRLIELHNIANDLGVSLGVTPAAHFLSAYKKLRADRLKDLEDMVAQKRAEIVRGKVTGMLLNNVREDIVSLIVNMIMHDATREELRRVIEYSSVVADRTNSWVDCEASRSANEIDDLIAKYQTNIKEN